jgi:hypothetical protein
MKAKFKAEILSADFHQKEHEVTQYKPLLLQMI